MVIFLQEDHELPLIDGSIRIRGGSRDEPAEKVGLVELYGEVWRTGGTKSQTGDQLDDYLEARAAKVETGGGADSTTIGWSCLKGDFDDVFKLVLDLLNQIPNSATTSSNSRRSNSRGHRPPQRQPGRDRRPRIRSSLPTVPTSPYARQIEYATLARRQARRPARTGTRTTSIPTT